MRYLRFKPLLISALLLTASALSAQDLAAFEKRVTIKKLDNGLTFLILERPQAPVFTFFTHVNAGSAQEVAGITGLAHMFEHMAFKGSNNVGTTNYEAERKALEKVEEAFAAYHSERTRETGRDEAKITSLEKAWKETIDEAGKYIVSEEFSEIVEREGGTDMNAFTSSDETAYFYSLPANRLELWAYLESERFLTPVMREFYKERDVVVEERRMRTDSRPTGRLVEQFLATAFTAHPYGQPGVGWPSDLQSISATDAIRFFNTYYVPANMVIALVGDIRAAEAIPVLQKYFGRLPKRPRPPALRTVEPKQVAERTVVLRDPAQPFYLEGYHKPDVRHPDDAVYDVISDLMSSGRTSRLYRTLVRDKKIAAFSAGFNGFPGEKYSNLFAFFAVPTPGHTPEEIRTSMHAEIARLQKEDVSDEELKMVKTRAKANLLRKLEDNSGLAFQLATAQARYGDWRELFRQVDRIDKVTRADIRRVAQEAFVSSNRTVGIIESTQLAAGAANGGE